MRLLAVTYAAAAAVMLCSAAMAQNNADRSSPRSSGSAQTPGQADIGTGQATSGRQGCAGRPSPAQGQRRAAGYRSKSRSEISRGRGDRQETAHLPRLLSFSSAITQTVHCAGVLGLSDEAITGVPA